jgi:hypothetical protein
MMMPTNCVVKFQGVGLCKSRSDTDRELKVGVSAKLQCFYLVVSLQLGYREYKPQSTDLLKFSLARVRQTLALTPNSIHSRQPGLCWPTAWYSDTAKASKRFFGRRSLDS